MANIDEAFAALSDVQSVSVNENVDFVVDSHLRVISIPVRGVVLGVEGDKDVNRVTFRMSRTYKGIDMSQFQIRINYANANNELNYFKVTEITVGDDEIVFVWVVGADAVAYVGNVEFVVRFIKLSGSNIIQELNTTLATAKSLIGLSVDGEISPVQREDLLAHFYSEIDAYSETKKNEILDSIPEDYTALANEVDELKGEMASVSSSGISAADATEGQVPTADGKGGWSWENQNGGSASGDGGYYTPSVDAGGNLSWTASKTGMPTIAGANIKGPKGDAGVSGENGTDGITPHIGENGNWYIGDTDTGRPSRGETGAAGEPGRDGTTPQRGVDYWTDADKTEIKSYVDEAILGGAW